MRRRFYYAPLIFALSSLPRFTDSAFSGLRDSDAGVTFFQPSMSETPPPLLHAGDGPILAGHAGARPPAFLIARYERTRNILMMLAMSRYDGGFGFI